MKRSDIRNIILQEIANIKKEAATRAVKKGTVTDNARLAMVLSSLGKRAQGAFQKRKVVSQVVMALATALQITPNEVLRAYMDYKKDAKRQASTQMKKED